eukprot:CAMPEP_0170133016 /NCGR_PEP_ID=MMETSP0033_2-20121228/1013_1 /TAXON_ID=195969 /ORGANISM="Dolichomastix tenuilepis, Strain CCMP3274" /LENGTH=126 /DNA_ID=CAMNT_0010368471 /DNA_START=236 /DNA_END=614 /DNA_ORIENTATION=+
MMSESEPAAMLVCVEHFAIRRNHNRFDVPTTYGRGGLAFLFPRMLERRLSPVLLVLALVRDEVVLDDAAAVLAMGQLCRDGGRLVRHKALSREPPRSAERVEVEVPAMGGSNTVETGVGRAPEEVD